MTVQTTPAGDVTLAYETHGDPSDPTVLLVMGLGVQLLGWDDGFVQQLVDRGLHVVRFDNRDVGESTHLSDAPPADLAAAFSGDFSTAAYALADMAGDTAALVEALDLGPVHVVGASMGGMIAQELAIQRPDLVASLTSIMSTPAPSIGPPTQEAAQVLLSPPATDRDGAIARSVLGSQVIGSPGFPTSKDVLRERAAAAFDRSFDPPGVARQLVAIQAGGDRSERLAGVSARTTVVHGLADPLVQVAGGRATAEAVPGARLELVEGMGHDLPEQLWPRITGWVEETVRAGDAAATA